LEKGTKKVMFRRARHRYLGGLLSQVCYTPKELGLDQGNFSKTITRWIDEGIVIRVGEKREARPLHVYPLPETLIKKGSKK
jgi:hypothetical protein